MRGVQDPTVTSHPPRPMPSVVDSIRAEFLRYQLLAERAIGQVPEPLLGAPGPGGGNSVATIAWHLAGNLRSRFTAFLTEDGEKPWRDREARGST